MFLALTFMAFALSFDAVGAAETTCNFTGILQLQEQACHLTDVSNNCCGSWQSWGNASKALWQCLSTQGNTSCSSDDLARLVDSSAAKVRKTCGQRKTIQEQVRRQCQVVQTNKTPDSTNLELRHMILAASGLLDFPSSSGVNQTPGLRLRGAACSPSFRGSYCRWTCQVVQCSHGQQLDSYFCPKATECFVSNEGSKDADPTASCVLALPPYQCSGNWR